ncbi:MAG: UDP-N-acetylmuramoyl-tripeptide--D-alanyl-D-alanine ligase [bacterium]
MLGISIAQLVKAVKGDLIIGDPNALVNRVCIDTRTLKKGDFFIALKGDKKDAHMYLDEALEKGAQGLLVKDIRLGIEKNPWSLVQLPHIVRVEDTLEALQNFALFHHNKFNVFSVGITGTNGKTTTKEMLASILAQGHSVLSTRGNMNNQIGLPLMMLELETDHEYAIFELGASSLGEIEKLASLCKPKMAIITNVSAAHLEGFGSIENILRAKWELVDSIQKDGEVILNADDPLLSKKLGEPRCRVTTFGIDNIADVTAESVNLWPATQFTLVIDRKRYRVQIPVIGKFNVYNALAAAAAAWRLGKRIEDIIKGLEEFSVPPMHMSLIRLSNTNVLINDAYNANPKSMRESILAFATMFAIKRKVVVLGTMNELGKASMQEHYDLGKVLASQALDKIFWYGEFGEYVAKGFCDQFSSSDRIKIYDSHHELVDALVKELNNPCAMLFKASRLNKFEEIVEAVKDRYKPC